MISHRPFQNCKFREMNVSRMHSISRVLGLVMVSSLAGGAWAQTYPTRVVRIVVGFTPGGSMDVVARLAAERLKDPLGQQVIVDNRPGGSGVIAADLLAKAQADGHTMMLAGGGTLAVKQKLQLKLPYDAERDFATVIQVANLPLLLVVPASLQARSVKELVAMARARPGKLNFSSSGIGSTTQLSAELFRSLAQINVTHVPYKGSSQMIPDLVAGEISFAFDQITTTAQHITAGRLRALAISTAKRSRLMPEAPTVAEAGVPGYESISWNGIVVPAATPAPVVAQINQAIAKVLRSPDMQEKLASIGAEAAGGTPEQFAGLIRSERQKWGKLIDQLGIKPE